MRIHLSSPLLLFSHNRFQSSLSLFSLAPNLSLDSKKNSNKYKSQLTRIKMPR